MARVSRSPDTSAEPRLVIAVGRYMGIACRYPSNKRIVGNLF